MAQIKLLIAEDEDNVRNSLYKFISANSRYVTDVYTAANGQLAYDLITRHRPHLMLIDIKMPLKSGLEVMMLASAAGICPKTIILSGHDDFEYAQQALRVGAIDYFLKPYRSSEILECIDDLAAKQSCDTGDTTAPGDSRSGETRSGNSIIDAALYYVRERYTEQLTLGGVAEQVGISPGYLSTLFARTIGCSFIEYLNKLRIERACDYFPDSKMKTYEIAFRVGFQNEKYFSNVFKRVKGVSPSEYRNK